MRFRQLASITALLGLLSIQPGNANADVLEDAGAYLKDRGHDLLDLIRLRGGIPKDAQAIGVKARATTLAQAGYVAFEGTYYGMDRRAVGIVEEERREAGVSVFYGSFNSMIPTMGNGFLKGETPWHVVEDRRFLRNLPYWDDGRKRPLSLGAEVATPILALDAGVYPAEALDLALGLFTIDLMNDDELRGHRTPYQQATTAPVPDTEAPFTEKRQAQQNFLDNLKVQQAIEMLEERVEEPAPQDEPGLDQELTPEQEMEQGEQGLISREEADEAMDQADQIEPAERAEPLPITEEAPSDIMTDTDDQVDAPVPHEGESEENANPQQD